MPCGSARSQCLATQLIWGVRRDSNPLILDSQTSTAIALVSDTVEPRGVEPLTSRLQGGRSGQLSYGPSLDESELASKA